MKCFTVDSSGVNPGILATPIEIKDKKGKPRNSMAVLLGMDSNKSRLLQMRFDKFNPPDVSKDSLIHYAFPYKPTGIPFPILVKAIPSRTMRLVRVNTMTQATKGRFGRWDVLDGSPKKVFSASGPRNRDDVIIMDAGDAIIITPEGSKRNIFLVLQNKMGRMEFSKAEDFKVKSEKAVGNIEDLEIESPLPVKEWEGLADEMWNLDVAAKEKSPEESGPGIDKDPVQEASERQTTESVKTEETELTEDPVNQENSEESESSIPEVPVTNNQEGTPDGGLVEDKKSDEIDGKVVSEDIESSVIHNQDGKVLTS